MERCWQLVLINIFILAMISACQMQSQANLREGFGDAVKGNVAMHVIDPEAGKEEPIVTDIEGQRAETILDRYRTKSAKVKDEKLLEDVGD